MRGTKALKETDPWRYVRPSKTSIKVDYPDKKSPEDTKFWSRRRESDPDTIDPRVKSRLGKCEEIKKRSAHDTSPWSGNAEQSVVLPIHKLSEVRERQKHDTTPWGKKREDDQISVVSTVSTIAPWDRDDSSSKRRTRAHFTDRQNRTTRLWSVENENDPTSSKQIVLDMIQSGLSPEECMSRLEEMFTVEKRRHRRRKKEKWPDGTWCSSCITP